MNDIRPRRPAPEKPPAIPTPPVAPPVSPASTPLLEGVKIDEPLLLPPPHKRHWLRWTIVGIAAAIILAALGTVFWYQQSLRPLKTGDAPKVRVKVVEGSSPSQIGQLLEEKNIIRSGFAFNIYTRLSGTRSTLQAGSYGFSPSQSVPDIVDHLTSGKSDQFSITFLPGATIDENKAVFKKAGYSDAAIEAAFSKQYDSPLFAGKPAAADLEGYIYGETYTFGSDATVEMILETTFKEYYDAIEENNLVAAFKKQELTLYEGIIMASIVQREVPDATDQKQVAQVFLSRYDSGMTLGSDITAYYGADKIGVDRSVAVDTPYNTRIHKGLPPGPVATPGLTALLAVANPAPGDYLYFLSGDDDVTYFAKTEEQHQENILKHCKIKCSIP